jgi:alpha-N-arabinofuranosidase
MTRVPHWMLQGIALHHYSVIDWNKKSSAAGFTQQEYFATMKQALRMEELIAKHTAIMEKTDPDRKVALVVDEWGGWYDVEPGTNPAFLYQQNTMRDAMIAGVTLNIFNNHCDRVKMANLAQTVNVLQAVVLTSEEKMIVTPTYHVMEMYTVHHDAVRLPVAVTTAPFMLGRDSLPAVSVSASKDRRGVVHISLVNIDADQAHDAALEIQGSPRHSVSGRILTSGRIQDHNTFDAPENVKPAPFTGARIEGGTVKLRIPPVSVVVLSLE